MGTESFVGADCRSIDLKYVLRVSAVVSKCTFRILCVLRPNFEVKHQCIIFLERILLCNSHIKSETRIKGLGEY